jgi:hypothetical protein
MKPLGDKPEAKHGSTGSLYTQDGLSFPVSITYHGDDVLMVVLEGIQDLLVGPLKLLMLESSGSRGIVRTPGAAEVVEGNLLRFIIDDWAELIQRREFVRIVAAKRVVLEDEDGDLLADGLTVDISGGGILVQLPRSAELPDGEGIFFKLFLGLTDYDDQLDGTVRIVRRLEDNRFALAFDHITRADQERLIRFVFERQRAALRVTRGDTL